MHIQIIGMGCPQCRQMEADVRAVVAQTGITAEISHLDDPIAIVQMGILSVPQLLVNGERVRFRYRGRHSIEEVLREKADEQPR